MSVFQDGEEGKEEEEKEFFGKLEYTLDYNFTDNQVDTYTRITQFFKTMTIITRGKKHTESVDLCPLAHYQQLRKIWVNLFTTDQTPALTSPDDVQRWH